jgi:hypothetical protein
MPFGLKVATVEGDEWDNNKITDDDIAMLFRQLTVICSHRRWTLALMVHCSDIGRIMQVMKDNNFKNIETIVAHKCALNNIGTGKLISAIEYIVVGHKPNRETVKLNVPKSPLERHNIIFVPPLNVRALDPTTNIPINASEKHCMIGAKLAGWYCRASDPVLIIGAGSGADVIGVNQAGFDVVAIERSARQFPLLCGRLQRLADTEEEDTAVFQDELECVMAYTRSTPLFCAEVVVRKAARAKAAAVAKQQGKSSTGKKDASTGKEKKASGAGDGSGKAQLDPQDGEAGISVAEGSCTACGEPKSDLEPCTVADCESPVCKECVKSCVGGAGPVPLGEGFEPCPAIGFCSAVCENKHTCPNNPSVVAITLPASETE